MVNDWLGFLPYGNNTIRFPDDWEDSGVSWRIDLFDPTKVGANMVSIKTADTIYLRWQFSDDLGIMKVLGDAEEGSVRKTKATLDRTFPAPTTLNYDVGSGATGTSTYTGAHLWSADNSDRRREVIELGDNEGGSLDFNVRAFDRACNDTLVTESLPLGEAWVITKGGVAFSSGGTNIKLKDIAATGDDRFSLETHWTGKFGFKRSKSDLSTELLTSGSGIGSLDELLHPNLGGGRILNYPQSVNTESNWFTTLKNKYLFEKQSGRASEFIEIKDPLGISKVNQNLTDIYSISTPTVKCERNKLCMIRIDGDVVINRGFVCDGKGAIMVDGNLTLSPDITFSGNNKGCLFIASGNITIDGGNFKSAGSAFPVYDVIEGFVLADGEVLIEEADRGRIVRDGLKIHGSLMGVASSNVVTRGIVLQRSLKLMDNTAYPVLAIHYDPRYLKIAVEFFGGDISGFKKEVGFKPL